MFLNALFLLSWAVLAALLWLVLMAELRAFRETRSRLRRGAPHGERERTVR